MKQILLIIPVLFLSNAINAQVSGNMIYEQNNRYVQNASYNQIDDEISVYGKKDFSDMYTNTSSNKEMVFEVNVLKNVTADSYLAIFNMIQVGQSAIGTDELINNRFESFKKELEVIGVLSKDIYLDMVSLIPVYEIEVEKKIFSKTYNEVPKGFEMQKNVHVYYQKAETLDKILTIAAKNEIYDLVKVEYFVNESEGIYIELRKEAVEFMQQKLQDLKGLNIDFDTIYHIVSEESGVSYPIDRYRSYQVFSSASIDAIKRPASVTTVQKPKIMFYNKLPYHKFDVIINPVIIEPAVQYTYQLTIKYVIKDPVKKIEHHFKLLTPDGNLKTLKIE